MAWVESNSWSEWGLDWNDRLERPPSKNGVALKAQNGNRYPLPAIVDGDYELEVEFTRHSGREAVALFFPVGVHTMHLEVSGGTGERAQVIWIDRQDFNNTPVFRTPSYVANNVRHKLRVQVKTRPIDDYAEFEIAYDSIEKYLQWSGRYSSLTNRTAGAWSLSMPQHIWLGTWGASVTFHSARVRMHSGEVQPHFITAADRQRDLSEGFVRLIGETANSPSTGWGRFMVNQIPLAAGPGGGDRVPYITREFSPCGDFIGAHAPSKVTTPIPSWAKSFSVIGYNDASRTTKYLVYMDGKQVYETGMTALAVIKVDVPPKATVMELVIDEVGDDRYDHSYWCYPRFHPVPAEEVDDKLLDKQSNTRLSVTSSSVGYGSLTINRPIGRRTCVPVHFRDARPCHEFLFAHAPSSVGYAIPDGMTRFTAIAHNVKSNSVKFEVWADGRKLFESPSVGILPISIKLPPRAKTLELKCTDQGNRDFDISYWCYPRFHRK